MKETEFTIWDVQHGSAAYIKSPNDKHIIVDAGLGSYENGDDFSPLDYLRGYCGVERIDYAILTHPHKDHIEDLDNLILLKPIVLRRPKHLTYFDIITEKTKQDDISLFETYVEFSNTYNVKVSADNDPRNSNNYCGLHIETFGATKCSTSNLNDHSIISVFSYATLKVIIMGDNEYGSYSELIDNNRFINLIKDSDVLVASHHGRESGFYKELVEYINPRITIISDNSKAKTSAASDYGRISRGCTVYSRKDGSSQKRNIVSTYNDGVIKIKIGYNSNVEPYLGIWIK